MNQVVRIALLAALAVASMTFSGAQAAGTWTQGTRLAEGRVLIQAAADGTDIYVAGGSSVTGPRASFDLYDTVTGQWRPLPPMPAAREQFGMSAFSGRIYVSGGRARELEDRTTMPNAELWTYDTVSSDWIMKSDMPTPRLGHVMVNVGDKLYVLGGTGSFSDKIYIYDIVDDTWSTAATSMKIPRKNFGATQDNNAIYVVGGIASDGKLLKDVSVFNTTTHSWTSMTSLPKARTGLAVSMIDGRLHVAGGSVPDPAQTFNEHLSLGSGDSTWKTEAGIPTARHSAAYAQVANNWYVIGGGSAAGFYTLFSAGDAVEVYTTN